MTHLERVRRPGRTERKKMAKADELLLSSFSPWDPKTVGLLSADIPVSSKIMFIPSYPPDGKEDE